MYIVSIIICNWNYERYLHECLDSVVNQTYRPIQIVFVDDGSTDNSIEIFKSKLAAFEKNDIEQSHTTTTIMGVESDR
jgi:glycosyltransferase involved in cell wall biosynthesis